METRLHAQLHIKENVGAKNWNATLTSWSRGTLDHIPQGIIDKATHQLQIQLRVCLKAKGCHFEHLLW